MSEVCTLTFTYREHVQERALISVNVICRVELDTYVPSYTLILPQVR